MEAAEVAAGTEAASGVVARVEETEAVPEAAVGAEGLVQDVTDAVKLDTLQRTAQTQTGDLLPPLLGEEAVARLELASNSTWHPVLHSPWAATLASILVPHQHRIRL